jgi:hypothetical protein
MKTGSVRGAELRAALQGDYWRADSAELIVAAWEQSGESLTAFARRHGVRPNRLARWRDRLRKTPEPARLRFHPVKVRETPVDGIARSVPAVAEGGSGLKLVLRGGRRIVIGRGFDAAVLVELMRVLESGPC